MSSEAQRPLVTMCNKSYEAGAEPNGVSMCFDLAGVKALWGTHEQSHFGEDQRPCFARRKADNLPFSWRRSSQPLVFRCGRGSDSHVAGASRLWPSQRRRSPTTLT